MDNQEKWDDLNTQVDYLMLEIDDVNAWREPLDFTGNVSANGQAGLDAFNADRDGAHGIMAFPCRFRAPCESNGIISRALESRFRCLQMDTIENSECER